MAISTTHAPSRLARTPWTAYWLLGAVLVAYLVSLLLRSTGQESVLVDGWLVAAFELVVAGLCLARATGARGRRALPTVLGLGLLSWAMGDLLLAVESTGGATPPVPSPADAFYLGFYPLLYVALGLLMRREVMRLTVASWMDGVVAGLGAAAVCACFAFAAIQHTAGGSALEVATNLAYPIGDVLLLMLVVGGSAVLPGRRGIQWVLIAGACALNAAGDTVNLFRSALGGTHAGTVIDGIAWPTSLLLLSITPWLRSPRRDLVNEDRAAGFLLPGIGACAGLGVLIAGCLHRVDGVAVALASATLVTVGVRLTISLRRLRSLTETRREQALTDELTGLGNRRRLFAILDAFFSDLGDAATPARRLAFLFVDLDHFKEINDSFGHSAGDELLRQLGPRLHSVLRESDVLSRIGGDELGVLVMDTDVASAVAVAERLTEALREPFFLGEVSVRISASIGIAVAPTDATDALALLRCADLAMYRAKTSGSAFEVYSEGLDGGGNRLRLVEELRVAVDRSAFSLHFQPLLDLESGAISAVEALLRWDHPRLGMVAPMEYLPLAEEVGLMPAITRLVLDGALAQCAEWRAAGRPLRMAVNVSVGDLLDPHLDGVIARLLGRHGLPPGVLIIEITETTIIRDFEACRAAIARLREIGVDVAIDDFGAGFTSLAHLGRLAVTELKLDRGFITSLGHGEAHDLALVRATIELGHALGLRVVAEGIEDGETLALVRAAGCDLGQGYHIGRPGTAEELGFAPQTERRAPPLSVA